MTRIILTGVAVLAIIYVVPFVVYGLFTLIADLKPPEGATAAQFLMSVLVSKIGTALAFVGIYYFARNALAGRWLLYAFLWWLMFVIGEVGQAIGPGYGWKEALAGIIAETIYVPAAGFVVASMIGRR